MPPLRPSLPCRIPNLVRTFSSTPAHFAKSSAKRLAHEHAAIPPYPYGASPWYKQANFGLYGHAKIRFGNMVSEKNEIKTRRHWRPNVQMKRLWSVALNKYIRTRVTPRVLRTVDRCGGLDEYLLGEKPNRIKELGMGGWKLRWRIMQTEVVKERFRAERERLGLPPKEDVLIGADGAPVTREMIAEEVKKYDEALAREDEIMIGDEVEGQVVEEGRFMEEIPAKGENFRL